MQVDTARSAASTSALPQVWIPPPLFQGLEGNLCQCPHWGFVLIGQITTSDAAGTQETVRTGDLFYWPPGHNVRVDADAEVVMFSPQHEHSHVIDHMIEKTKG